MHTKANDEISLYSQIVMTQISLWTNDTTSPDPLYGKYGVAHCYDLQHTPNQVLLLFQKKGAGTW